MLAAPGSTVLEALRLPLEPDDAGGAGPTAARCDDDLLAGLTVDVGPSTGYRARAGSGAVGCFRGDGELPAALVARVDRRVPTYAVGGTDVLTNDARRRAPTTPRSRCGCSASATAWSGTSPTVADVAAGDDGPPAAPARPGVAAARAVAARLGGARPLLWRGRRLGRLVVEPLPVVVQAVESTESRGRLYRRARDRAAPSRCCGPRPPGG